MTHDELEQRLWELEYGLLSDEDAAALRKQIADDPEVTRRHDRVRSRLSLVARAARIEAPRIKLRIPGATAADPPLAVPVANRWARPSVRIKRGANWSLGIAATLLIGLLGWATWRTADPNSREVAENTWTDSKPEPLIIKVDAPAQLSREAKNPITVSTITADGTPQSADLHLRLKSLDGVDLYSQEVKTNKYGRAQVELPGTPAVDASKLNVAYAAGSARGLQVDLAAPETQYSTHLSIDKPRYRPGDVVRYRSVTLSRFGLTADRDVTVEYEITDPAGQEIAGSKLVGTTERGVGNGELPLSADAAPGQYTLFARSPGRTFPDVQQNFAVQKPTPRQYDVDVNWENSWYAAGSQAHGNLVVRTPGGQPASDVKLNLRAFVDGRQVELPTAEVATDAAGKAVVGFGLPAQIAASEGELGIQVGQQDVIWKDIPLQADQVQVDFYPEGGDLTASVENRVYFHCHDFDERAVVVRGRVVDAAERVVATVATQQDGRGAFRFTPDVGASYALVIDDPPMIKSQPVLPPVVEQSRLVLDAGAGVFDGDVPIHLTLRSHQPPTEFSVVAYCRGATVGHQTNTASDFVDGVCALDLPVIAEAAGVLRVTVFDYSKQPPEPLAERLVYRYPHRKLHLQWKGLASAYATGDAVRAEVVTTDETGKPVSAVLGISAVDKTVLELAGRPAPQMTTQFLLLGDVDRAEKLEDANFYLSADPEATVALDLLLGTQGWRRFDRIPVSRFARAGGYSRERLASRSAGEFDDGTFGKKLAEGGSAGAAVDFGLLADAADDAPRRFDNRPEVEALRETSLNVLVRNPEPASPVSNRTSRRAIVALCIGLLLIGSAATVIRRYPTRTTMLISGTVAGCLFLLSLVVIALTGSSKSLPDSVATMQEAAKSRSEDESRLPRSAADVMDAVPAEGMSAPEEEMKRQKAVRQLADNPSPVELLPMSPAPAAKSASAATSALAATPTPAPILAAPLDPAPEPAPAPDSATRAVRPVAPKAAGMGVGLPSPGGVPALKPEQARPRVSDTEAMWRRSVNRPTPKATESPKKLAVSTPYSFKGVDSPKGLGGGVGGVATESAGSRKLDRDGQTQFSAPNRYFQESVESKAKLYDRFVVRRYATVRAKDKNGRSSNDFTESVFWNPLVITDEQGHATIEFDLPDTETKFRILADGHSDGRLGSASQTVSAEAKK